jgi:hypothetical protein
MDAAIGERGMDAALALEMDAGDGDRQLLQRASPRSCSGAPRAPRR